MIRLHCVDPLGHLGLLARYALKAASIAAHFLLPSGPEAGSVREGGEFLIVPVFTSTGTPRIISPPFEVCGSELTLYDDSGCGSMEPFDPMSLYDPARLVPGVLSS